MGTCGTRLLTMLFVISTSFPSALDEPTQAPDPTTWYKTVYFPHWEDTSTLELNDVEQHFFRPYFNHESVNTRLVRVPNPEFAASVQTDIARGWIGDSISFIESESINSHTATIRVKIQSSMENSPDERFCFWYIVSKRDESWGVTSSS